MLTRSGCCENGFESGLILKNKEPRIEAVSCCYDFLKPVIVSRSQTMLSLLIQFFGLQMLADTIKIRF